MIVLKCLSVIYDQVIIISVFCITIISANLCFSSIIPIRTLMQFDISHVDSIYLKEVENIFFYYIIKLQLHSKLNVSGNEGENEPYCVDIKAQLSRRLKM